jgi:hypothetical protein
MFHYRNGINPAVIDAQKIRFEAAKGEHELLIALGTNDGKAWGIFLRLERLDVAPKQLKRKSEAIIFPELL